MASVEAANATASAFLGTRQPSWMERRGVPATDITCPACNAAFASCQALEEHVQAAAAADDAEKESHRLVVKCPASGCASWYAGLAPLINHLTTRGAPGKSHKSLASVPCPICSADVQLTKINEHSHDGPPTAEKWYDAISKILTSRAKRPSVHEDDEQPADKHKTAPDAAVVAVPREQDQIPVGPKRQRRILSITTYGPPKTLPPNTTPASTPPSILPRPSTQALEVLMKELYTTVHPFVRSRGDQGQFSTLETNRLDWLTHACLGGDHVYLRMHQLLCRYRSSGSQGLPTAVFNISNWSHSFATLQNILNPTEQDDRLFCVQFSGFPDKAADLNPSPSKPTAYNQSILAAFGAFGALSQHFQELCMHSQRLNRMPSPAELSKLQLQSSVLNTLIHMYIWNCILKRPPRNDFTPAAKTFLRMMPILAGTPGAANPGAVSAEGPRPPHTTSTASRVNIGTPVDGQETLATKGDPGLPRIHGSVGAPAALSKASQELDSPLNRLSLRGGHEPASLRQQNNASSLALRLQSTASAPNSTRHESIPYGLESPDAGGSSLAAIPPPLSQGPLSAPPVSAPGGPNTMQPSHVILAQTSTERRPATSDDALRVPTSSIIDASSNTNVQCERSTLLFPQPGSPVRVAKPPAPDRYAIHQLHLQSPILKPPVSYQGAGSERCYQVVESFPLKPSIMSNSPLQKYRFSIHPAHVPPATPTSTQGGPGSRIIDDMSRVFRMRCISKQHASTDESAVYAETIWPKRMSFTCNGQNLTPRRKVHYGKDLPINLTTMVRPGDNEIDVFVMCANPSAASDAERKAPDYALLIERINVLSHRALKEHILAHRKPMSETLEEIKRKVVGNDEGDDDEIAILNTTIVVKLTDPILGHSIWNVPVRSKMCRHLEAFDLEIFMNTRPARVAGEPCAPDTWQCPICGKLAHPKWLLVDEWLLGVRSKLAHDQNLDARAIEVDENGAWTIKEQGKSLQSGRSGTLGASTKHDAVPEPMRTVDLVA